MTMLTKFNFPPHTAQDAPPFDAFNILPWVDIARERLRQVQCVDSCRGNHPSNLFHGLPDDESVYAYALLLHGGVLR